VKKLSVLVLALVFAGCGAGAREHGTATLWVTRDRGAHVVYAGSVPAGLNGIQTVERKLKVTTRYGGRYVQSIAGVSGSLGSQRDWFFFVDGVQGDQSAADVRIHPGDVLWWDYRHWTPSTESIPVVAGAYPEPFLRAGPTSVVGDPALARPIARQVHGVVDAKTTPRSFIVIGGKLPPGTVKISTFRGGYLLQLGSRVARRLAHDPTALRYRF
jgi:Domain of unknown function (DUF4430)